MTIHPLLRHPATRIILVLYFAAVSGLLSFAAQSPVALHGGELARESLERTAVFFAGHEELQQPRGSMWKHFVSIRDFLDRRTVNGVLPTAADRVRAWKEKNLRQALSADNRGWFCIGPRNISGRIVDLDFHPSNPQKVYAASAGGGLWISNDGGGTWHTTTDGLPSLAIGAVCVVPSNPDVVLAATGEGLHWRYVIYGAGIWKSTDSGKTWGPTNLTYEATDNHGFHVMEANPITGTVLAGANDGLWRSTDEGDTWTRVLSQFDCYDVKWKPGSANRVYATRGNAASSNGVIVSTDDGVGWTPAGSGQPLSSRVSKTRIAVTPADPDVIYAHYGDSQTYGTLGIYRSTDSGLSWSPRNTTLNICGGQGGYAVTIAVDPDDVNRVIAGGINLYQSSSGGTVFAETGGGNPLGDEDSVHVDHHAIAWEPGSISTLWVGTDGGPWRSTDNGETWSPRRDGLVTTQHYDLCLDPGDPGFAMGGAQDNGLPWTEEADRSWFPSTLEADGCVCIVEPLDPDTIYSEWQFGGHIRSTDRGWSWQPTMSGLSGNSVPIAPLALDPNQPGRLFTATSNGIFRTTNGQDYWVRVASHQASWISISPVDGDVIWTVDTNTAGPAVRVTSDGGSNWTPAAPYGFTVGNETKVLAHPTDPATAFVIFAGYSGIVHVLRTTDFGATWKDVSGDFPPDPANTMVVDPEDPDHWFVGTDTGVWYSVNNGLNWVPLGSRFPNVVVYDLEIQPRSRKLVAITYGRGAWETSLLEPGSHGERTSARHDQLMLDPPILDPSGDRVRFRFASRAAGRVTLHVYDSRGRLVEQIADLSSADGIIRTAQWDSSEIPSGTYFVLLRSGFGCLSRHVAVRHGRTGLVLQPRISH